MEFRIHHTDMSKADIKYIDDITTRRKYITTDYLNLGLELRNINEGNVIDTVYNGKIIELHLKDNDIRILKRSKKRINENALCVVYSLTKDVIITAYWNNYNDNHHTLDWSKYTNRFNVEQVFQLLNIL